MIRSLLLSLTCLLATQLISPNVIFSDSVIIRFANGDQESLPIQHFFDANGQLQRSRFDCVKSLKLKTRVKVSNEPKIFVQLTNGDMLFVDQFKCVKDSFEVIFFGETLLLPIENVREVTWSTTLYDYQRPLFSADVDDIVALENDDLVKGEFITIGDQQLRIVTDVGLIEIPVNKVKTLFLSPQLSETLKESQIAYECYFSNGSVVTADSMTYSKNEDQFQLRFAGLYEFAIAQEEIMRVELWSDSSKRISSEHLKSHYCESFFGREQAAIENFNTDGQLLVTPQMSSKYGFGVRSHSRLTFEIPPEAVSISGTVGLDARGGQNGAVKAIVLVDGQIAWQTVLDRHKSPAFDLPVISLQRSELQVSSRELELVVDFDATADVGDQVNWQGVHFQFPVKD